MQASRLLLKIGETVSGPHSLEALQQMASVHAFDEDAQVAPDRSQPWTRIGDLDSLNSLLFPPVRKLALKAKPVGPLTDAPRPDPITVTEILQQNVANEAPRIVSTTHDRHFRRRDFIVTLTLLNVAALAACFFTGWNPLMLTVVFGLDIVATVGVYWVFYHIMDPY